MTIEEQMNELIRKSIQNEIWDYAKFSTIITQSGSSKPNLWIHKDGQEQRFIPDEIFEINKLAKTNFNTFKDDIKNRFNTVEFEVYRDGSYQAHYYWDEGIIDDQKRRKAQQMAGWLAQRIPVMISYQGYALYDQFHFEGDILNNEEESNAYGNHPGWRAGVFTFDFRNNDLKINIELEKEAGRVRIPLQFEDWFIHDLWEHYEITTKGMLSKEWRSWNVLEIKLEKDTGHDGGKTIEPEIRYLLL